MQFDLAQLGSLLSMANDSDLVTVGKLGLLVFIADRGTKVVAHVKKKNNGGTEYDKLAGILRAQKQQTEALSLLVDLAKDGRTEHEKQTMALQTIAAEARTTNGTITTVIDLARTIAQSNMRGAQ